MTYLHKPLLPILLALLLLGSGMGQPNIVVSIHPWYDLVRQIAGEEANIVRILPAGASPHTFEPRPSQIRDIAAADLVVMNGGIGVDEWLLRLVTASGNPRPPLQIMEYLDEAALEEDDHHHEHDHEQEHAHEHGYLNPHVWLDPHFAAEAVQLIVAALVEIDPENEALYRENGEQLRASLDELDREIATTLEGVAGEAFVPFHNAWPYFARRYGLDLIVEIEPFPGREPSPAYLANAISLIRESGARAIFTEPQLPERPAQVVAESAGIPLFIIDPIGGTEGVETHQQLLRSNARIIANALSGGQAGDQGTPGDT